MNLIYVAVFFLNYKHLCKIKVNTKSVTDFQNCAVKVLITFLKSWKAFRLQNICFSFSEKEPCLGQLAGKISLWWKKTLLDFKMWLQCSEGTLHGVVAGMEPLELQGTSGLICFCFKLSGVWGGKGNLEL